MLPGDRTGSDEPTAVMAVVDGRPLVVTNASGSSAAIRCANGWTSVSAPGPATATLALGADAYVIAGGRLWRATIPAC
jgi:hypothetical protein